jgi:hypothetical protein
MVSIPWSNFRDVPFHAGLKADFGYRKALDVAIFELQRSSPKYPRKIRLHAAAMLSDFRQNQKHADQNQSAKRKRVDAEKKQAATS